MTPEYEVLALKYAWRPARRADLFIGGDPHDADTTMDYYLWIVRGEGRFFLVDTGCYMRHDRFARPYEPDHIIGIVRLVYQNKVVFHDGDEEIAPGLSLHRIGGHTMGMQAVRVHTRRGWVVLASDASHYYEHFESGRGFPLVFNVGELIEGYGKLTKLASSPRHVVPGHDPLVMHRYPPVSDALRGIAVRLDAEPLA